MKTASIFYSSSGRRWAFSLPHTLSSHHFLKPHSKRVSEGDCVVPRGGGGGEGCRFSRLRGSGEHGINRHRGGKKSQTPHPWLLFPTMVLNSKKTVVYLICSACYICFLALHLGSSLPSHYRSADSYGIVPSPNLGSHRNLIVLEDSLCQTTGP